MIHTQMTHPLLLPTQSGPPTEIMVCLNFNQTKERIRQISNAKKLIPPRKSQQTTLPLGKFLSHPMCSILVSIERKD